ncbi:MAG: glycosyltransferase family 4 protein, partial [Candidatus Omnitrophica bacterium]|nr:glycosyltransferase family 4 protein [Candidatus Omnitrophota bacterium]
FLFLTPGFRYLSRGRIDLFLVSWYFFPSTLFRLTKLVKNFKPDVVNVHFPDAQIPFVLRIRKKMKFRLVVSLHGDDIARFYLPYRRGNLARLKRIFDAADAITACSGFILTNALRLYPVVAQKGYVVHNGIEPEMFYDKTPYVHVRPYVFACARFTRNKGLDILVEAFSRVVRMNVDVDLIIAGEGEDKLLLQHIVNRLGLCNRIHFFGKANASEIVKLLYGCQFVVVPSRHEAFNLTIIEAFAAGKPAVATRSGGPIEIIEHGVNGLLVDNENHQALAAAILTLFENTILRNALAKNATSSFSRFTASVMGSKYLTIFQKIMGAAK